MEEIKKISQKTASELADLMYAYGDTMSNFADTLQDMMACIVHQVIQDAVSRFMYCMERYACSTFITKWYWKRKLVRSVSVFREITLLREKIFSDNEKLDL